jgi:starch synthase (maltosyl-transferring)
VTAGPIIYNLFPRLVGAMKAWIPHIERAAAMGFNTVYVNPFHYPGFSGSLYAPKHHDAYNPQFLGVDRRTGDEQLAEVVARTRALGMRFMMDLVINHTSIDCPLVAEHPSWFRRGPDGQVEHPSAIDPADARRVTVWGDLAEVDNAGSSDRDALWDHWRRLVIRHVGMGITDFRCDAAYKVPPALWSHLIGAARAACREARFFAETLGCRLEEVVPIARSGFDYLFNSSRWWNLADPWCLEQYEQFRHLAPSVSFPESHDTPRLAAEMDGNVAALKMRYAFAAFFSAGVMTVLGYEWGFRKAVDVVRTQPFDMEPRRVDLSGFLADVNHIKAAHEIFNVEAKNEQVSGRDAPVFILKKSCGEERVLVIINRDLHERQRLDFPDWDRWLAVSPPAADGTDASSRARDISPGVRMERVPLPLSVDLDPAQVLVLHARGARGEPG